MAKLREIQDITVCESTNEMLTKGRQDGASTAFDRADGTSPRNTNSGFLGHNAAGGETVGVAGHTVALPQVPKPELELQGASIVITEAEDGEEAWKAVASFHPDLVLLDVMMPRMDGFAVLEIIRAGFETARLPVILLTAKGEDDDKVRGLRGVSPGKSFFKNLYLQLIFWVRKYCTPACRRICGKLAAYPKTSGNQQSTVSMPNSRSKFEIVSGAT